MYVEGEGVFSLIRVDDIRPARPAKLGAKVEAVYFTVFLRPEGYKPRPDHVLLPYFKQHITQFTQLDRQAAEDLLHLLQRKLP